jgi:hypothetical protein
MRIECHFESGSLVIESPRAPSAPQKTKRSLPCD